MAGPSPLTSWTILTTLAAAPVLTDGNRIIVVVIAVVALAALGARRGAGAPGARGRRGHRQHEEDRGSRAGRRQRLPGPAVPHPRRLRGRRVLPAHAAARGRLRSQRIGRSIFFLVGAGFSAATGYIGMWLAVRSNVRVAAAAREATPAQVSRRGSHHRLAQGDEDRFPHRRRRRHVHRGPRSAGRLLSSCWSTRPTRRRCWRASASVPR